MKVSIITVVYNNESTLRQTITSIIDQNYNNIEYIIIDGGSTDGTLNIIHEYSWFIHKIISEPDLGIYDAMNKGINYATGEIVAILNSDDIYYDNSIISIVVQKFINDINLDIIYGDLYYVKKDNVNKIVRKWTSCDYYPNFFDDGNVPPHPSLFIKKNVYLTAGFFNLKFNIAADYDFMFRIFKIYNFKSYYLNKTLVKMRLGGESNNSIINIIKANYQIKKSWKSNGIKFPFFLYPKKFLIKLLQFF